MAVLLINYLLLFTLIFNKCLGLDSSPWHYECSNRLCIKQRLEKSVTDPLSLELCQLTCNEFGALWPRPNGHVILGNQTSFVNYFNITAKGIDSETVLGNYINNFIVVIQTRIKRVHKRDKCKGTGIVINFALEDKTLPKLTLNVKENYSLKVEQLKDGTISVTINAENYYGARNGLETMFQLIIIDEIINDVKMLNKAVIEDSPVYPYRGILLDTARNFIHKKMIIRTIQAMGMSKLNSLHLHLTDSQSFPYFVRSLPLMSYYGSYSPEKVYTFEDIQEIIEIAQLYGVRIVPEIDTPGHVGEGWQWVEDNFISCFNAQPRYEFCSAPPCGQLNPVNPKTYAVLASIYTDLLEDFQPTILHLGGNDVSFKCWNTSESIQKWMLERNIQLVESNFHVLWDTFINTIYDLLLDLNDDRKLPVILWSSNLMDPKHSTSLDPEKYIIQITAKSNTKIVGRIIRNNFTVIMSNYDYLFLDCGFSSWVDEGNNWCSPYKGWQLIYDYSPRKILSLHDIPESYNRLILGSEAILWSVQTDNLVIDSKLWPRSAALAERLWSDPESSWEEAESRFLRHRERLTHIGVLADTQTPEWCLRNEGNCN